MDQDAVRRWRVLRRPGGSFSSSPLVSPAHAHTDTFLQVHRICFALALFHLIHSLLLIGVKDTRTKRAAIQNGFVSSPVVHFRCHSLTARSSSQLVGTQGRPVACPRLRLVPHPERLLHQILLSHPLPPRFDHLHPHRPRPPRRLCPLVVRNLPRTVGGDRLALLEVDSHLVDPWPLRPHPRPHYRPVHLLQRQRLRAQHDPHHAQLDPLSRRLDPLHLAGDPGVEPPFRPRSKRDGRRVLQLPRHLGNRQPR